MTRNEENRLRQGSEDNIQRIIRKHEFVSLPKKQDGTQLAVRTYNNQHIVFCDILIYRKLSGIGRALRDEVTCLLHALSDLQTELPSTPHYLDSTFRSQTINFLGKTAHILTSELGIPLYCQIIPLLFCQTDAYLPSIRERAIAHPVQVIRFSHIEQFMTRHLPKQVSPSKTIQKKSQLLRQSYRNLGFALILLPLLVGLTGILLSFAFFHFASVTMFLSVFGPVILLRKATNSFKKFQIHNSISLHVTEPKSTKTSKSKHTEFNADPPSPQELTPETVASPLHWTPTKTVAYFQDSTKKAIQNALSTPQGNNRQRFFKNAQAFLINWLQTKTEQLPANLWQLCALEEFPHPSDTASASIKTSETLANKVSASTPPRSSFRGHNAKSEGLYQQG